MNHDATPLRTLTAPSSIGVLGVASDDHDKAGNRFVQRLLADGFKGDVHLLGRAEGEYLGIPIYDDPANFPEDVDLVLSAMGPGANAHILPKIAARKARNAIIFSAGYAEMGDQGKQGEQDLIAAAAKFDMRIIGPNCLGMFNLHRHVNLTSYGGIPTGPVGLVSQSGNVALTLFDEGIASNLGFSTFVSFGNQSDIEAHELIDALGADDATEVIVVYLEGLRGGSGAAFLEVCQRVSRLKPIVAMKGGRTGAGKRAAESHTASLSSDANLYRQAFEQTGVIEVDHLEHLYSVAEALVRCPPMTSRNVAIVGSGGGHSTIASDELEFSGLRVPEFPAALQQRALSVLPAHAPVRNPIDMTGQFSTDPSLFATLTRWAFDEDASFGGALNYGLFGTWGRIESHGGSETATNEQLAAAALIGQLADRYERPIIFYTPFAARPHPIYAALRQSGIPCFDDLSTCAAALSALAQRGEFLARMHSEAASLEPAPCQPQAACDALLGASPAERVVSEAASLQLLARHGIRVVDHAVVGGEADLAQAAQSFGFPLVLKAMISGQMHKSEFGAVALGLSSEDELRATYERFAQRLDDMNIAWDGQAIVARDLGRRDELIFGARRDDTFGTVIMFGVGGIDAEALGDVALVVPPIEATDIERGIASLRGSGIFHGHRGRQPIEIAEVATVVAGLHGFLEAHPEVDELDLNPMMVVDGKLVAADASIQLVPEQ